MSEIEKQREEIAALTEQNIYLCNESAKAWGECKQGRDKLNAALRVICFLLTGSHSDTKAAKAFGWDCFKEDRAGGS